MPARGRVVVPVRVSVAKVHRDARVRRPVRHRIAAFAAVERVGARTALHHVVAGTAIHSVRTGVPVQNVRPGTPIQLVVASAAKNQIGSRSSPQLIGAGEAKQQHALTPRIAESIGPGASNRHAVTRGRQVHRDRLVGRGNECVKALFACGPAKLNAVLGLPEPPRCHPHRDVEQLSGDRRALAAAGIRPPAEDLRAVRSGLDFSGRRQRDRANPRLVQRAKLTRVAHPIPVPVLPYPEFAPLVVGRGELAVTVRVEVTQTFEVRPCPLDIVHERDLSALRDLPVAVAVVRQEAVVGTDPAQVVSEAIAANVVSRIGVLQRDQLHPVAVQIEKDRLPSATTVIAAAVIAATVTGTVAAGRTHMAEPLCLVGRVRTSLTRVTIVLGSATLRRTHMPEPLRLVGRVRAVLRPSGSRVGASEMILAAGTTIVRALVRSRSGRGLTGRRRLPAPRTRRTELWWRVPAGGIEA